MSQDELAFVIGHEAAHHIAGVHRDDTMTDYLATNDESRMARKIGFLGPWIADLTGQVLDEAALRQAVSVDAAFLAKAFEVMEGQHGSIDAYLADVLGVDAGLRARIERRILG